MKLSPTSARVDSTIPFCYERELKDNASLRGTANVSFTIDGAGQVTSSTITGFDNKAVRSCMAKVIEAIEFPPPKHGEVTVQAPITLRPAPAPRTKAPPSKR